MRLERAFRTASIVLGVAMLVNSETASAQPEYDWTGYPYLGTGLGYIQYSSNGTTVTPVPNPPSVTVSIDYWYQPGLTGTTVGDTTFYPGDLQDTFTIVPNGGSSWPPYPSYFGEAFVSMGVTVPTGGGLDQITFTADDQQGFGYVTIFAPLGTLSSSTEVPPNLSAFLAYGQNTDGGSWQFISRRLTGASYSYLGTAAGGIGPYSVPEPGSFWLLASLRSGCCEGAAGDARRATDWARKLENETLAALGGTAATLTWNDEPTARVARSAGG